MWRMLTLRRDANVRIMRRWLVVGIALGAVCLFACACGSNSTSKTDFERYLAVMEPALNNWFKARRELLSAEKAMQNGNRSRFQAGFHRFVRDYQKASAGLAIVVPPTGALHNPHTYLAQAVASESDSAKRFDDAYSTYMFTAGGSASTEAHITRLWKRFARDSDTTASMVQMWGEVLANTASLTDVPMPQWMKDLQN